MSPHLKVCHKHRTLIPLGQTCPKCAKQGNTRRRANNHNLGRTSPHWRSLSLRLIRKHRNTFGPQCPQCLRPENPNDPSSKLTLDLTRGGDHTTATEDECRVMCRRCHGSAQGARRAA